MAGSIVFWPMIQSRTKTQHVSVGVRRRQRSESLRISGTESLESVGSAQFGEQDAHTQAHGDAGEDSRSEANRVLLNRDSKHDTTSIVATRPMESIDGRCRGKNSNHS